MFIGLHSGTNIVGRMMGSISGQRESLTTVITPRLKIIL